MERGNANAFVLKSAFARAMELKSMSLLEVLMGSDVALDSVQSWQGYTSNHTVDATLQVCKENHLVVIEACNTGTFFLFQAYFDFFGR